MRALVVLFGVGCAAPPSGTAPPPPDLAWLGRTGTSASTTATDVHPSRIIVGFDGFAIPEQVALPTGTLALVDAWEPIRAGVYAIEGGASVDETLAVLRPWPGVAYAEPDHKLELAFAPDDTFFDLQVNFANIGMEDAWDASTGAGVVVAVIDSGLADKGKDTPNVVPGYDFADDDSDPFDGDASYAHGTHVAGTVAQATDNGEGVAGVAFDAEVMPLKVMETSTGYIYLSYVVSAVEHAVDEGAHVINMSLGSTSYSSSFEDMCDYADDNDVNVFASSGNNGYTSFILYPAAYTSVVAVGAVDHVDVVTWYSNKGALLDIVAPGGDTAADDNGDGVADGILQETRYGGSYSYQLYQGTSMASPHAAGVAALLRALGATADEARSVLESTAVDLGASGFDNSYGHGRIDAAAAVEEFCSANTWYRDADGDGYGDAGTTTTGCPMPSGYVGNDDDCNDASSSVHPAATEVCDSGDVDQDCDGTADDADGSTSSSSKVRHYRDSDGDGYGDASDAGQLRCDAISSRPVTNDDDCDDSEGDVNPAADEVCDAANADEDCDGKADNSDTDALSSTKATFYDDDDGDGYGDASDAGTLRCDAATGEVSSKTDCDDANKAVHPGATEVCDSEDVDEDCDGKVDDADSSVSSSSKTRFYDDDDGDGFGDAADAGTLRCDAASGEAGSKTDCDDTDAGIHPNADEVCDAANTDEDCDGKADDADSDALTSSKGAFYVDADGDGYGDANDAGALQCDASTSRPRSTADDCDDAAADVNPGADEVCDPADTDEDCDGLVDDADDSVLGAELYFPDADGDGFANAHDPGRLQCDPSATHPSTEAEDCNDADGGVHPAATEVCDGGDVDENCNGVADDADLGVDLATASTFFADADGDGFGDSQDVGQQRCDPSLHRPVATATDCDDHHDGTHPGAAEVCDARDNDCDSDVDDDAVDAPTWYVDTDGDGFGDAGTAVAACEQPQDHVDNGDDCDDDDADAWPGSATHDASCALRDGNAGIDGDDTDSKGGGGCATTQAPARLPLVSFVLAALVLGRRRAG